MTRIALCITFLLAGSIGCGVSDANLPAGEPMTIPASAQTARAVPGLATWELYQVPEGVAAFGITDQRGIVARSSVHGVAIDSQGTRVVEIQSEAPAQGTLRLTYRGKQLLGHEMVGQSSIATSKLVSDLQTSSAETPYTWQCWLATATVVSVCGAAILEGGVNIIVDADCIEAFDLYVTYCAIQA
jgi:hypothetical protein